MHRTIASVFVVLSMALPTFACGSTTAGGSEEARIAAFLGAQGFDTTQISVEDHEIVVEGDIVFDRDELEAQVEAWDESHEPRAYYSGTVDDYKHVCVDPWNVLGNRWGDVIAATLGAVEMWSQNDATMRSHVNLGVLGMGGDCSGGTVELVWQDLGARDSNGWVTLANADWPSNGTIGAGVRLNSNPEADYAWDDATLSRALLLHELGHSLGFAHPEDRKAAGVQHVPGTKAGTGYETVMHAAVPSLPLTDDDIVGLHNRYFDDTCFDHNAEFDRSTWSAGVSFTACSDDCPCTIGEGDCDSDADCAYGLECVDDPADETLVYFGYSSSSTIDLCLPSEYWPDFSFSSAWHFDTGVCDAPADTWQSSSFESCAEGMGDCQGHNAACASGHVCIPDIGWVIGVAADVDLCARYDEHTSGACKSWDKCGLAEGSCTADDQCLPGLRCGSIGGHANVCMPQAL